MPSQSARGFKRDLKRAGVPDSTDEGELDFHALRVTAITWMEQAGATDAQVKAFGRHATNRASARYRKTRVDDLRVLQSAAFGAVVARSSPQSLTTGLTGVAGAAVSASPAPASVWHPHRDLNPGLQAENLTS